MAPGLLLSERAAEHMVAATVDDDALRERLLEAAGRIAALALRGVRLTEQGMWTALELPPERAAIEYDDRQQIMATHGVAPPEAIAAFLDKRPARIAD